MKNAGIYIRVSTEKQAHKGYSVAAQKNNLIKFAKENNFNIYKIYSDEGISGKNIKDRPEVKNLINDIESGLINIVLIYKFDRLTRNISDTEGFINLINKYTITIYTLSEGTVDVNTPQGRFVTRLKGAVAQLEREQTSERIKIAFIQKVKNGYSLCCNTPSYGYNRKKGQKITTINHNEAEIVKRIFKMYLENYSFSNIAKILNEEHIPTKMYGKKINIRDKNNKNIINTRTITSLWQPKTIKLILSNPNYIGKVRYGIGTKQYFETAGQHKPIIDKITWNKVQERLKKIKTISHTNLPKDDVYYCGTLICGICKKKLTTNRTIGKIKKDGTRSLFNNYRCINREKQTCSAIGVSHNKVEKAFLKYLEKIEDFNTINELVIKKEQIDIQKEITNTQKRIQMTIQKNKKVMDMFMANSISQQQLTYMNNELKKNIKINQEKLKELKELQQQQQPINKKYIPKSILQHWKYLTNKEKLLFLTDFIKKIVIINNNNNHKGEVEILDVEFYD